MLNLAQPYFMMEAELNTHFDNMTSALTNKSKYCHFHMGHGHNIYNCIKIKDEIDALIKIGQVSKYVKGGKRDQ